MYYLIPFVFVFVAIATALPTTAANPRPEELNTATEWVTQQFAPVRSITAGQEAKAPEPGLTVISNYGPVQLNSRDGNPLRIADRTFASGLFCHAISDLLVRLPGPAKTFTAVVGGETNGNYSGGSMDFSVRVGDSELYHSPVLLRGQPGIPVSIDLERATEFNIAVGDGGDNINSDQACWGDACVTLLDGTQIRLGDMAITQPELRERCAMTPPFSFIYDSKSSDELLGSWKLHTTTTNLDDVRTQTTQTYTDPETGLQVRCVVITYKDFPTIEWTLYFRNTGLHDTAILSDIRSLDTTIRPFGLRTRGQREFRLHHFTGSPCGPNDYQPFDEELGPKASKHIATTGGRPTNSDLPYFNIETGAGAGVIVAVSWAGQWAADFIRDERDGLRICAGQEQTRFRLHPGEEVRSPMSVLQFYHGDWIRAQNMWRSWMITHNIPTLDGKPIHPLASVCTGNSYPGIITNAADELNFLHRYVEEGLKPDFWWQDAGWYPCGDPPDWSRTGTWEVDLNRWPRGIREVSDWCRTQDIRTIVWFEPERVVGGTWLTENHPEWILGGKDGGLLNLGLPQCRQWLTDHIDKLLTDQGIDLYRQDFNIDPLPYWRANDASDRQGITEAKYVEGYYAYWDELKRRHPGMLIDSCASGGRRNDLETLRRAVPLLRSDYTFEPVGEQCHTYGISFWMPFNGTGFITFDKYLIRSQMSPEFTMGVDTRINDADYDLIRKLYQEWQYVSPCYFGDYYPLSAYSLTNSTWMAWQFDRPDLGRGFFQAFRRAECLDEATTVKLRGLDPSAIYTVVDLDNPTPTKIKGRDLMKGFKVHAAEQPAALIFTYEKTK